jgi:hypothetical protein
MRGVYLFLSLCVLCCVAFSSWADTDYHCLNTCVNGGGKSADCMNQCSFGTPQTLSTLPQTPATAAKNSHKQFDAPLPSDRIIMSKPTETPGTLSKDYQCIAKCAQQGLQYGYCERRCTTLDTSSHSSQ